MILAYFIHHLAQKTAFLFSVKTTSLFYFILLLWIISYLLFHGFQSILIFLKDLLNQFPLIYDTQILPFLELSETTIQQRISQYNLPFIAFLFDFIQQFSLNLLQTILYNINTLIFFFPNIIFTSFIFFFSAFLFLLDYDKIQYYLEKYLPHHIWNIFIFIKAQIYDSIIHLFSVTIRCALCCFVISMIILWFLKIPHFFWMALALALLDSLPLVGSSLILIPWIILELFSNHIKLACGLAILAIILMISHTLLENHLLGKHTGIPSFILFVTMIISQQFLGIGITLLVPLILFVIQNILSKLDFLNEHDSASFIE